MFAWNKLPLGVGQSGDVGPLDSQAETIDGRNNNASSAFRCRERTGFTQSYCVCPSKGYIHVPRIIEINLLCWLLMYYDRHHLKLRVTY